MSAIATASLLPSPARRRNDEERLNRDVVQFLGWVLPDDATFYHVPNGGLRSRKVAARLTGMGVKAGIPDLAIVYRGRALFIELKAKNGVVSRAQRDMARKLIYCGAPVMLCRSVPEVEAQLREACVPLRASVAGVKISDIVRDMLLQPRAELHREWIEEYARDIQAGAAFPPIVVFFDGSNHWLADGFHRTYAREVAGFTEIDADIRPGTRRDALRYSISANAQHGYRRTNHDKRRAVDIMLDDPEWSQLMDREIAEACLVTDRFVASRKRERLVAEPNEANGSLNPDAEQPALDDWVEAAPEAEEVATDTVEPFDWDAAKVRSTAMDAIRALADLPSAPEVMAAWMKSNSYGEPVETLERALSWLNAFLPLYCDAEPRRWARVQMAAQETGMAHAAE